MAEPIGALRAELSANTAKFEEGMKRAREAAGSFRNQVRRGMGDVRGAIDSVFGSVFSLQGAWAALTGAAGIGGFGLMIRSSLDTADAIAKLADRTGLTIEALQEFTFAASMGGVSAEEFEQALGILNRKIGEGEVKYTNASQALYDIADRIAATEDGAQRAAIAFEAFGRSGQRLIPFLQGGSQALRAFQEDAHRAGIVLPAEMVRQAEAVNDAYERMGKIISTSVSAGLLTMTPQLEATANWFARLAVQGRAFIEQVVLPMGKWSLVAIDDEAGRIVVRISKLRAELAEIANMRGPGADIRRNLLATEIADLEGRFAALKARADELRGAIGGVGDAGAKGFQATKEQARELEAALKGVLAAADAKQREVQQLFDATRTPAEKLAAEIDRLGKLAAQGAIDWDLHARGVARAKEEYNRASGAADAARASLQAMQQAQRDQMNIAQRIYEETRTPLEKYNDELERLDDLLQAGTIDADLHGRAVAKAQKEMDDSLGTSKSLKDAANDLGLSFSSAFEEAVVQGKKLSEVLRGLAQDVIRIAARKLVTEPLGGLLSSGFSSVMSGIGSFLGFGGARAGGGGVDAGKAYLVGEQGPELFVPEMGGTVIANDDLGRAAGGINVYADLRGASVEAVARLHRMVTELDARFEDRAVNAVRAERFADPTLFGAR